VYALLSNPIYIGEIAHKGARYPGQHAAILDRQSWEGYRTSSVPVRRHDADAPTAAAAR